MNILVLSVAYFAVAQLQPSQFAPDQTVSPVQPAQLTAEPDADARGGAFRLSDQEADAPVPPGSQSPEAPSQLRPARNWSIPQEPQAVASPAPTATQGRRDAQFLKSAGNLTATPGQVATRARSEAPVIPIHSTDLEALAAMILDGAIEMHAEEGTDIALVDLLRRISDNASRRQAVQGYWRLCMAMAEQNFARHEARYLSELLRPQSMLEESLLTAEVTQARARHATAALKVLELQEQLVEAGRLELTGFPRPVDRPFVGPYATHFETLFADRPAPSHLRRIDRHLPHQLEVIERRAEAVAAGERAASQLAEAYETGGAGLSHVLDSLAQLSRTRRELLAAVLSYNEQIAEYSFAVVRPGVPTESLLGTLIRREVAAQPTMLADANVRPASAETPLSDAGTVDDSLPLRPTADPQTSPRSEPAALAPDSRSILKRVTIDHR